MDRVKELLGHGWARAKEIPWNPATVVLAILALGVLVLALDIIAHLVRIGFYVAIALGIGFLIWRMACGKKSETVESDDEREGTGAWWEVFGS